MKKKCVNKPAFQFGWVPIQTRPTIGTDGYLSPREWQEDCFNQLLYEKNWILNAPMASGKSLEVCYLVHMFLKKYPNYKAIISVPQTIIASGFRKNLLQFPDGSKVKFIPQHDICKKKSDSNTDYVIDFLIQKRSKSFIPDRVLLCSHQSLIAAFKKNPNAFSKVVIVGDEAHHVKLGEVEGMENVEVGNEFGKIVSYACRNEKSNIHFWLTTATFFRGDRHRIIPKKYLHRFKKYDLAYDDFLRTCKYLQGFHFDYILYNTDYIEGVRELFANGVEKTILHIPHVMSKVSTGDKYDEVSKLIDAIAGKKNAETKKGEGGLILVKRGKSWIRVMNLVDETDRELKKRYIAKAHKAKDDTLIDVIIALGMFKEGANWRWATRSIIVGPRNSLVETIQMVGRLFRDVKGKKHVHIYQLLPFSFDQTDEEKFRETLNNYLKAIFASMILEEIFNPIRIKLPSSDRKDTKNKKHSGNGTKRVDYLKQVVKDETEIQEIYCEIVEQVMSVADDMVGLDAQFEEIVFEVLESHGIKKYKKEIAMQIRAIFMRRTLSVVDGLKVEDIDFDLVKDKNPFGCLLEYVSGLCDIKTFEAFRKAIIRGRDFVPYQQLENFMHEMRANGQPIESMAEYRVFRETNFQNYEAVLKFRANRSSLSSEDLYENN